MLSTAYSDMIYTNINANMIVLQSASNSKVIVLPFISDTSTSNATFQNACSNIPQSF